MIGGSDPTAAAIGRVAGAGCAGARQAAGRAAEGRADARPGRETALSRVSRAVWSAVSLPSLARVRRATRSHSRQSSNRLNFTDKSFTHATGGVALSTLNF